MRMIEEARHVAVTHIFAFVFLFSNNLPFALGPFHQSTPLDLLARSPISILYVTSKKLKQSSTNQHPPGPGIHNPVASSPTQHSPRLAGTASTSLFRNRRHSQSQVTALAILVPSSRPFLPASPLVRLLVRLVDWVLPASALSDPAALEDPRGVFRGFRLPIQPSGSIMDARDIYI